MEKIGLQLYYQEGVQEIIKDRPKLSKKIIKTNLAKCWEEMSGSSKLLYYKMTLTESENMDVKQILKDGYLTRLPKPSETTDEGFNIYMKKAAQLMSKQTKGSYQH